jgi:hypothetical protein
MVGIDKTEFSRLRAHLTVQIQNITRIINNKKVFETFTKVEQDAFIKLKLTLQDERFAIVSEYRKIAHEIISRQAEKTLTELNKLDRKPVDVTPFLVGINELKFVQPRKRRKKKKISELFENKPKPRSRYF